VKSVFLCVCILLLSLPVASAFAQKDKKAEKATGVPANKVNSALSYARAANTEQRYQDSERVMLQVTQAYPQLVLPWVELGNAQLGLKKYSEAENSFKIALGITPSPAKVSGEAASTSSPAPAAPAPDKATDLVEEYIRSLPLPGKSSGGLSPLGGGSGALPAPAAAADSGDSANSPASGGDAKPQNTPGPATINGESRPPQITGPVYASLGEVYAREGKVAEAQAAFDQAVALLPAQAAQYRANETIVFFDTGQGDAELAAVKQAIPLDPERPSLYYFKGQALLSKATVDPKTQKLKLSPECVEAFRKFLKISPNGQLKAQVTGILTAAGVDPGK
jgi:tetratricopeptide (TPR) repeat protein